MQQLTVDVLVFSLKTLLRTFVLSKHWIVTGGFLDICSDLGPHLFGVDSCIKLLFVGLDISIAWEILMTH